MTDSSRNIPPVIFLPPGQLLTCELTFHEGPTTNTTPNIISKDYPYKSMEVAFAFQQLKTAKKDAFQFTKDHVRKYEEDNPNGYCAWVKTVWYTDLTSRETMTSYMKGIQVDGVPGEF